MDIAVLIITHMCVLAIGLVAGRVMGFEDAQPPRDKRGRFIKKD